MGHFKNNESLWRKKMKTAAMIFIVILLAVFISSALPAAEKPSAALGQKLFKDTSLGGPANTKTCNTCHPDGKGLEKSGLRPNLAVIINKCIQGALGGKAIAADSVEMKSLILYIKSVKSK
jgi:cytochrome c peroxidase